MCDAFASETLNGVISPISLSECRDSGDRIREKIQLNLRIAVPNDSKHVWRHIQVRFSTSKSIFEACEIKLASLALVVSVSESASCTALFLTVFIVPGAHTNGREKEEDRDTGVGNWRYTTSQTYPSFPHLDYLHCSVTRRNSLIPNWKNSPPPTEYQHQSFCDRSTTNETFMRFGNPSSQTRQS